MAQVTTSTAVHDVVVIGSGAGGGTVTKVLADLGISVLLLEAGPMIGPADFKEHMWPYQVPHRGAGAKGQAYTGGPTGFTYSATFGGAQLEGEPYTVAPGSDFSWFRSRVLGGRTNHYGRVTLRMADYDFKPKSTDGLGFDWPIAYADMAPYYDKAERFIGVTGTPEGIRSAPDGIFNPPAPFRAHDVLIQRSCAKLGIKAVADRRAVTTVARNGRPACHYCGQCGRGCQTASNYAASYVQIFPAMATGRVKVLANSMARELITDDSGKVTAVSYIDKTTGTEQQVRCRTVVLAASACESARLLLNSKGKGHPAGPRQFVRQGRALPDGHRRLEHVGHDSRIVRDAALQLRRLRQSHLRAVVDVGSPQGVELPARVPHRDRWRLRHARRRLLHRRGRIGPRATGPPMKQAIRDEYGTSVGLSGRGEMIPNEQSYCEIDPEVKDRWGTPVLRFHWQWSDHELNQVRHMQATFREILEGMGGRVNAPQGGGRGARGAQPGQQAPQTGQAGPQTGSPTLRPVSRRRRWASAAGRRLRRTRPGRQSPAAAPSSTRWVPSAWATTRRRAP